MVSVCLWHDSHCFGCVNSSRVSQASYPSRVQGYLTFMLLTPSTVHMTVATLHSFEVSFLLRFIPVLLMNLSSCIWDMADIFYRITEPFASMSEPGPAVANLLLDYPSTAPVAITIKAIQNGHWRVALCSTFSLLATIPPIIAGSICIGTPKPDGVVISIELINFWVSYVLLIVYSVFIAILRPTPSYHLPRVVRNLCDVLSCCYRWQTYIHSPREG
jgi:hypothetical protein